VDESADDTVDVLPSNPWRELELQWPDTTVSEKDNTVVFAKFKRDETK
jgi:hypothetical protein